MKHDPMANHAVAGMTEGRKKAFELAAETSKQLLTLATAVIAFTVTFLKDVLKPATLSRLAYVALVITWGVYLSSAVAGILTLSFLSARALDDEPELIGSTAQSAARWQMILFGTGLLLTVFLGIVLATSL